MTGERNLVKLVRLGWAQDACALTKCAGTLLARGEDVKANTEGSDAVNSSFVTLRTLTSA